MLWIHQQCRMVQMNFDTQGQRIRLQERHKNNWFQGRENDVADRKLFMKWFKKKKKKKARNTYL